MSSLIPDKETLKRFERLPGPLSSGVTGNFQVVEIIHPCSPNYKKEMKEHPWASRETVIRIDCDHVNEKNGRR